jgi:hypothetical protein
MATQTKLADFRREYTIEEFDRLPEPKDGSYYLI